MIKNLLLILLSVHTIGAFRLGVDNCSAQILQKITNGKGKPCVWGLVTNQTGLDSNGTRTVKVLQDRGATIRAIFAPEHGYHGKIVAGVQVTDAVDEQTNIPILSLYKKNIASTLNATTNCLIDPKVLSEIDGFIVDLQDCGMRHYTYISALYQILNQALVSKKKVLVLDRPNPLAGCVEGPLVDDSLRSYISIAPVALRHGLTMGEFARYCNKYFFNDEVDLQVIPMTGYQRTDGLKELAAALSPNIASIDSCKGYSFLGLLGEIDPIDVGVKTAHSFCCIALPKIIELKEQQWESLQQLLKNFGITSTRYEYMSGTKNQVCSGLRIIINDIHTLKAFTLFLAILEFFKKAGVKLTFSNLFDKAVGTCKIQAWHKGQLSRKELDAAIAKDEKAFLEKSHKIIMYKS